MFTSTIFSIFLLALNALAAAPLVRRQTPPTLSPSEIAAFKPYTYYAAAAYCKPSKTLSWSCGAFCDANKDFKPEAAGGNGGSVQYWFVGFDPILNSVIVAHQGTDPKKIESVLTDLNLHQEELDTTRFPGLPSNIRVHVGWQNAHASTASSVLSAVESVMSTHGTTHVTLVGHSLGAALALIDSVYLPLHLPAGTTFKTVCYGMPRVGNQAFADYVDAHVNIHRINNDNDPVPIIPGRSLNYHHSSGEVHIWDDKKWYVCPGQDNTNVHCSVGDVLTILDGSIPDHYGPYDGVSLGKC